MKVLSYPNNKRVWKSQIAAAFAGVKLPKDCQDVSLQNGENRKPEFLKLNPFGQVPTLQLEGGQGLFESTSIMRYIARLGANTSRMGFSKGPKLYGSNDIEASRIDGFLDVIVSLESNLGPVVYKITNMPWTATYTEAYVESCKTNADKIMQGFELALTGNQFLVGNGVTLADIAFFTSTHGGFSNYFTRSYCESKIPNCAAHFRRLQALPEFKAVAGADVKTPEEYKLTFDAKTAAAPAAPVRYHRHVTVSDGKTTMKLKLYPESNAADVQDAIRARFRLAADARLVLVDEDDCDVVIDGTLETGSYKLTM